MMKELTYFFLPGCPYCQKANEYLKELREEYSKYATVKIKRINEIAEAKLANAYDYYYVPAFFIDHRNLFEGDPCKEDIVAVLNAAIMEE